MSHAARALIIRLWDLAKVSSGLAPPHNYPYYLRKANSLHIILMARPEAGCASLIQLIEYMASRNLGHPPEVMPAGFPCGFFR